MTGLYWIFAIFDAGALLMLVAELTSSRGLYLTVSRRIPAPAIVVAIVISYAAELTATTYAAFHQALALPRAFLPVPLTSAIVVNKDLVTLAVVGTAAIQSYLLLLLYRAKPATPWIAGGSIALVVLSLISPVMVSNDTYASIGDALLGLRAYAPPPVPFQGAYAVVNVWWPPPLPPTPYGPLWLAVSWLVTAPFGSLLTKVVTLRLLEAAAFAAILVIMRDLHLPARLIAVAALNPGIAFEYLASGHNDLFGIALLCGAAIARRPLVAATMLLAGALVKLPFALFGMPLILGFPTNATRIAALIGVPVVAAAMTFAVGGAGYYHALLLHTTTTTAMAALSGASAAAVVLAMVWAAFRGRRLRSVVWLTPLAAAYSLASYTVWGLPYALARRNVLGYLLVAFPIATALLEVKFATAWSLFAVVPGVFVWQILSMRRR